MTKFEEKAGNKPQSNQDEIESSQPDSIGIYPIIVPGQIPYINKQTYDYGKLPAGPTDIRLSAPDRLGVVSWMNVIARFYFVGSNDPDNTLTGKVSQDDNDDLLILKVTFAEGAIRGARRIVLQKGNSGIVYVLSTVDDPDGSHLIIQ